MAGTPLTEAGGRGGDMGTLDSIRPPPGRAIQGSRAGQGPAGGPTLSMLAKAMAPRLNWPAVRRKLRRVIC